MSDITVSEAVKYIGANDRTLDLFESQYILPNGVAYNSYVILDEKVCVMDTADRRAGETWFQNLGGALGERKPDYLVISHMEPDHAANIGAFVQKYPSAVLVGNAKTFAMIGQFFDIDIPDERKLVVKEGDELELGAHTLKFIMAPMVHWPEVMMTYEKSEKILFSADAFGKFGALDADEDWACEARRYYFNIVGKYGTQVQAVLKKAAALEIRTICPLHGPILKENLGYYIEKYNTWSSYTPEDKGVFIAYTSVYGHTEAAAFRMKELLEEAGVEKVAISDLSREDFAENVEDAFRYDRLVLATTTYDGGIFPSMEEFLMHLKSKNYQKRKIGIIENGTWAPMAAKGIASVLAGFKDIEICENVVTIRSKMSDENVAQMKALAEELA